MIWYQLVEVFGDTAETFMLFDGIFSVLSGLRDICESLIVTLFC